MSDTLSQRLRAKLALEEGLSWDEEDALHELDRACLRGRYLEHARLQPILEQLCVCVEVLENYPDLAMPKAARMQVLTALEKLLEEK